MSGGILKCGHTSPLRCTRECYDAHPQTVDPPDERHWARINIRVLQAKKNAAHKPMIRNLREYLKTGVYPYVPI